MKAKIIALCLPFVAAACAHQSRTVAHMSAKPMTTRTITRTTTVIEPGKATSNVRMTGLEVSEEIAHVCKLPEAHFAFDSAQITGDAQQALDKLADCFTKGELAGRKMKIIGHADPRGTEEYNLGLGQRRAAAVADYLAKRGLAADHMETASLGALEATGKDEAGWAKDRKVEILLGDEAVVTGRPVSSGT